MRGEKGAAASQIAQSQDNLRNADLLMLVRIKALGCSKRNGGGSLRRL